MAKRKPIHLYDKLFGVNYYICYGFSRKEFIDFYKHTFRVSLEEEIKDDIQGFTCGRRGKDFISICIWTKRKNLTWLAHEALHATAVVMDIKKTPLCRETEEVYAYNIMMIMGAV